MNYLCSLERWDRGFEHHSRYRCLCMRLFCVCVVLRVGSGLATGLSLVHGVLPSVQKIITELTKRPGPSKGCRAIGKKNSFSDMILIIQTESLNYITSSSYSGALLHKPVVCLTTQEIPSIVWTRKFVTLFTRAHHWSLSWARWIWSKTSQFFLEIYFSYLRLRLPSCVLHSGFPTNTLYALIFTPVSATWPVHPILLTLLL
jgi:hypothetical protein